MSLSRRYLVTVIAEAWISCEMIWIYKIGYMREQFHIDLTGSLLCSRPGLGRWRTSVCSAVFTRYDSINTYLVITFLSVPFAYPPFRVILSRLCCLIWFDHHSLRYDDGFVCIVSRVCHDLDGCLLFFLFLLHFSMIPIFGMFVRLFAEFRYWSTGVVPLTIPVFICDGLAFYTPMEVLSTLFIYVTVAFACPFEVEPQSSK